MLFSAFEKAKLFAENFTKKSNLDDSGISLTVFSSRTNLKLHNISVTPKMVKKVIMNLDLSKASGPNCIPVVVLKNCEPELSYILAELFHLKNFRTIWKTRRLQTLISVWRSLNFQIVVKFHPRSQYLRMFTKEGLQLTTTALLVFFLWLVKSLKNL